MSAPVSLRFGVARAGQTYHAGENGASWELIPECLFVADAILDDHDGCPPRVDGRFQLHGHVLLIDGLVGAHDVIYRRNLRGRFDHYFLDQRDSRQTVFTRCFADLGAGGMYARHGFRCEW